MKNLSRACFTTLAVFGYAAANAQTQPYPAKSVRVIVPQSSGSASDTAARVVGGRIATLLNQQFVVDNRPGAGGLTGSEMGAKAAPDGYTLTVASISSHGTIPALYRKLSYDAVKDFAPVTLWVTIPNVLAVHPSLPVRTTGDLIALAKARPGQINSGHQGNGSSQHLATELFKIMAGNINIVLVPYKGSGPGMIALLAGEVSVLFPTLVLSTPHIQAGRIKPIAVTTAKRLEGYAHLPTVADTLPGFELVSWIGLLAPAGTPQAAITRLNEAGIKALAMPDIQKTLAGGGMNAAATTPEQFGAFIQSEIAKWTKVARAARIEAE